MSVPPSYDIVIRELFSDMQTPHSNLKFQYVLRLPLRYYFNWGISPINGSL